MKSLNTKSRRTPSAVVLLCSLALLVGTLLGYTVANQPPELAASSSMTSQPEFQTLEDVWDLVHDNYVDPAAIDDQALLYGAATGMMDAVGDQGHTSFLDPTDAKSFQASLNGELIGIGVRLDFDGDYPKVIAPIPDSPAEEAGIRRGDLITRVDGVSTRGWSGSEATRAVKGEEGEQIELTLERPGDSSEFEVTLVRRKIKLEPVAWAALPENIAIVRLNEFSAGASDRLREALAEIMKRNPDGIVFDLRANPGGYVAEAVDVASAFMPEGMVVYLEQKRDQEPKPVHTVGANPVAVSVPMVVLVDEASASAAEVVTAALQDNGRATVVGVTTFGTGTVVSSFKLDDGSMAAIGTSLWLTPAGKQIWKEGLQPDISVVLPADGEPAQFVNGSNLSMEQVEGFRDEQLLTAIDLLRQPAESPSSA